MFQRVAPNPMQRRRGATTVEFAVVVPVLLIFIFGLFEFGRLVMVQQAICNAAREGCRVGALRTTVDAQDVDTAVRGYLQSTVSSASDPSKVIVEVTPSSFAGIASGTSITVHIQVAFSTVSWLPGNFFGFASSAAVNSTATMDRE